MTLLSDAWSHAIAPADRRPTRIWAHEFIELPAVLSRTGKFSTEESRHFEAPLDCLDADTNRETSILAPPRSGKSLIADVATASAKARENAAVLRIFIDDKLAKAHAELRQNPMIDACPPLARMLPANRHEDRVMETIFTDGLPLTIAGPALSNLQQRGYKFVNLDECWNYPPGTMANARARMGDFVRHRNNKYLCISQGGEEDSDWALHWATAVLYEWHVPCLNPFCGKMLIPRWNAWRPDRSRWGLLFDAPTRPDGSYDEARALETLRFECYYCRHAHADSEETRQLWNRGGRYLIADAPDEQGGGAPTGREPPADWPEHAGFHWNNLIDFPWRELVRAWLLAQHSKHVGVFAPLVAFFQKQLAQMRSERNIFAAAQPVARAKVEAKKPRDKTFATATWRFVTADRQSEDVYWVTIRDWAADGSGESQRVFFGKVYSDAAIEELVARFGAGYWETRTGEDGQTRDVFTDDATCVMVDSGYRPKGDQGVYSFCARRGWIALKGAEETFFWHNETDPANPAGPKMRVHRPFAPPTMADPFEGDLEGRQGRSFCTLVRFSSSVMADHVRSLIAAGVWMEPEGDETDLEREYRVQMAAEFKKPRVNKFTGKKEDIYVCPSGNNHAFDCAKEQVFAAMQVGLLPGGLTPPPAAAPSPDEGSAPPADAR